MKKFWKRKRFIIPAALLMIGGLATVAAATLLFTHTFPSVTVPGVPALVTSLCSAMVIPSPPSTPSGNILFGCTSGTPPLILPAFKTGTGSVAVQSSGGIPVGYTDLYAVLGGATAGTCAGNTGSVVLLSSNPGPMTPLTITVAASSAGIVLAASTAYFYCADYTNPSTSPLVIPTFTVSWQQ